LESDVYKTIDAPCEGLFKAKGSKHFGFVFPVRSEEEVQAILLTLKKQYHDARHHAYAFRLGHDGGHWRASDDGEPSNSAGPPILGALRSKEITWCLGVVVRYFGGTKLGVGGLIEAYREATLAAIGNGEITQHFVRQAYRVRCPYELIGSVLSLGEKYQCTVSEQVFLADCAVTLAVRESLADAFEGELSQLFGCAFQRL